MSEKIEPALSPEEWSEAIRNPIQWGINGDEPHITVQQIAVANAALPSGDPRKITREKVEMMRRAAWNVPDGYSGNLALSEFADALESYLPPEGT